MAIATYSDLKTVVASWLHRSDLDSKIPDFITLAESRLNRRLRLRAQEYTAEIVGVIGSDVISLPESIVEPLALWMNEDEEHREELRYIDPDNFINSYGSGEPQFWTIDGIYIRFNIQCDDTYKFAFRYRRPFALSNSVTTNWLLTNHPDVYLYASLLEAGPFIRDAEASATWREFLEVAIAEIELKESRSRSFSTLSIDGALSGLHTYSIVTGE